MGVLKARRIMVWILTLVTIAGSGYRAQDEFRRVENIDQLVGRLNEHAARIETIQSNFIQQKQLEFLDETIISKGAFWFKKENNLRWAYKEPFDYVIVIHEGRFSIRDGEQVSAYDIESNPAFAGINNLIVDMVRGNITGDRFERAAFENSRQYKISLVPKDNGMREVISTMEIYFNKLDLTVEEVIMKESEKDYTVIKFIDKKINEPIEDPVFSVDY
jgi:outer membrane lipoprotein-sorting protein